MLSRSPVSRDRPDLGTGVFPIRKVDQLYYIINQEMLIFCLQTKYFKLPIARIELVFSQNNQYPSERNAKCLQHATPEKQSTPVPWANPSNSPSQAVQHPTAS